MKDKRLQLKLSVRGDGSLSRNGLRSSTRSNRSNTSSNSTGLPVNEFFAIDRYAAPYNRPYFDMLDKYRRPSNQYYPLPAQSLQNLNQYEYDRQNEYRAPAINRNNPYIDYNELPRSYNRPSQHVPVNRPPPFEMQAYNEHGYSTLPHQATQQVNVPTSGNYTLPRSSARRVRISELQPIVHGYGMLEQCVRTSYIYFLSTTTMRSRNLNLLFDYDAIGSEIWNVVSVKARDVNAFVL